MDFVESFDFFGTQARLIPCLEGEGAPTASTAGAPGVLYRDSTRPANEDDLYVCYGQENGEYLWKPVGAGARRVSNAASVTATNALNVATNAANTANTANNDAQDAMAAAQNAQNATQNMGMALESKVDGAYVENGYLYLTSNNEVVAGPLGPFSGSGGGGGSGGNNAVLAVSNASGWLSKNIGYGEACPVTLSWSSTEDDIPTGNGTMKITVNGVLKVILDIAQGTVTRDISPYLGIGSNAVRITISDVYENSRTVSYSINAIDISLSSSFDASAPFTSVITFPFTPVGNVPKVVSILLDGEELTTINTTSSGRQMTYLIPQQSHGAHSIEAYFTAEINGQEIESNHLYYEIICVNPLSTDPIIVSPFRLTTAVQYTSLVIPYTVYSPAGFTAQVQLKVNGDTVSSQTVDRTEQSWTYRADEAGELELSIVCGTVSKTFTLDITESDIQVEAETDSLSLFLSSYGRSNNEEHPGTWEYNDISATFSGFNFESDGWKSDEDGITALRVSGDARLMIPVKPFAEDFRVSGKTIELEFATRNVLNYDTTILSCMSGGRGILMTPQLARLASEQSEIATQYKENEHVRISFVVEKRSEWRLIFIYINGIMSGCTRYPDNDDFSQSVPVNISIGSNDATIDLYNIRIYENSLTRHQILNNWIADTQSIDELLARYGRNNVFDAYDKIVISKLPADLPYLILEGPELPQSKGDKKTVSGTYTDPASPSKNFTFEGASCDVQGTSSQGYARKNYKIKFSGGFTLANGTQSPTYAMRTGAIPVNTFTFKADVASSEGCNNVELVRLYNEACPYRTPPQEDNPAIRQGIDGFPIVIFWYDGETTTFLGKYNFNNDKGTEEVYGFEDGDESWEILNNTSDRVLWKSDNYSGSDWLNDFEGRFPDGNTDGQNLAALAAWLVTTDQAAAAGDALDEAVEYDGVSYDHDTAAYRLAKFKAEFTDHFEKDAVIFYYLFTELFLMVDSRAKNAFPTFMGGSKWFSLPYDMDTAIGINNEGSLTFSYNLEDIDQTEGGADVFNGQQSVLWINLRQAFYDDIMSMYQTLRSQGKLSYDRVETAFEEHQAKWPEAVFNEDSYFKYLAPLEETGTELYLPMLQGSKAEQRKWWLYNRFRYMDSKYNAGDSLTDFITLRGYAKDDITITPYADVYASVKYGSYLVQTRAARNQEYTLECPLDNVNDTEIYIYSASQLKDVGDVSGLKPGLADFSMATKLQALKIGDSDASYSNGNLTNLTLGNNVLLRTIDVRNCPNLVQAVDVSGCVNVEEIYFDGTGITGLTLPNGGILKKLHLPGTVTNLTIRNQGGITEFVLPSYDNITTLRLENVSSVIDSRAILEAIAANSRVRLIGFDWEAEDAEEIGELYDILDTMRGLDENGNNMPNAQVSGRISVPSLKTAELTELTARYPGITIAYEHIDPLVTFYNGSTLLDSIYVTYGTNAVYTGDTPTKASTDEYDYAFSGWTTVDGGAAQENALNNVTGDLVVYAAFAATSKYPLSFYNGDVLLGSVRVRDGEDGAYTGSTPTKEQDAQYVYTFSGWSLTDGGAADPDALTNVTEPRTVYAAFSATLREYDLKFYNGDTLLSTVSVPYGTDGSYSGSTPTKAQTAQYTYSFSGWSLTDGGSANANALKNVTADRNVYAAFTATVRTYTVTFVNNSSGSNVTLQTVSNVAYGSSASYTGSTPVSAADSSLAFEGWSPSPNNITGNTTCYAQFASALDVREITDSWETVLTNEANGTYASVYKVGNYIELDLGTEGTVYAQIAGINMDDKADGSGKAKITWICRELLATVHRMNPARTGTTGAYDIGTGAIGGWENSEMRSYLKTTIKPLIPATVRNAIVEVSKQQPSYNTAGTSETQSTTDDVWIPSYKELFGSSSAAGQPRYSALFPDNASRVKSKPGASASAWWLRSAGNNSIFDYVHSSGSASGGSAYLSYGVALGFCT